MRIQDAGSIGDARHITRIKRVIDELPGLQRVLKTLDLEQCSQNDAVVFNMNTHGFLEQTLINHESTLWITTEQVKFTRLIG